MVSIMPTIMVASYLVNSTPSQQRIFNQSETLVISSSQYESGSANWPTVGYALMVICVIAVLENVFVVTLIRLNRKLREATTNVFVFSLCVANILFSGILLPLHIIDQHSLYYKYLTLNIVLTYIMNLGAVTYERHFSITRPLHYHAVLTKARAYKMLSACYIVPIAYCLVPFSWGATTHNIAHKAYMILTIVVFLIAPLVFIVWVYCKVFTETRRFFRRHWSLLYQLKSNPGDLNKCRSKEGDSIKDHSNKERSNEDGTNKWHSNSRISKGSALTKANSVCSLHGKSPQNPLKALSSPTFEFIEKTENTWSTAQEEFGIKKEKINKEILKATADLAWRERKRDFETQNHEEIPRTISSRTPIWPPQKFTPCLHAEKVMACDNASNIVQSDGLPSSNRSPAKSDVEILSGETELRGRGFNGADCSQYRYSGNMPGQRRIFRTGAFGVKSPESKFPILCVFLGRHFATRYADKECFKSAGTSKLANRNDDLRRPMRTADHPNAINSNNDKIRHTLTELKASLAFALVALTYMFTWLPVIYMSFLEVFDFGHLISDRLVTISIFAIGFNAMVDPLLYGLLLKDFRAALIKLCRWVKK